MTPPTVLTIAGSDSSGGAGIQADLKTFAAHKCYGASVIVALTAQNTRGVTAIHNAPADFVKAQLDAVLVDLDVRAVKTGMLSTEPLIEVVAAQLATYSVPNIVVDPVMVSKSGHRLLQPDAIRAMSGRLVPMARLITPNAEEAAELLARPVRSEADAVQAARALGNLGPRAVLVKGGHLESEEEVVDVLWDGREITVFRDARLNARHTHGTGCTLSSAIAANLALGRNLRESIVQARAWLRGAMTHAYEVGGGISPVNHLWQG